MKLKWLLYRLLVLVLSFHTTLLIGPRRRIFENLGRIHDAIHELNEELPGSQNDPFPFRRNRPNRFVPPFDDSNVDGFRPNGGGGGGGRFRGQRFDPRTGLPFNRPGGGRGRGRWGGRRRNPNWDLRDNFRRKNIYETTIGYDETNNKDNDDTANDRTNNNHNHQLTKPNGNGQSSRFNSEYLDNHNTVNNNKNSDQKSINWETINKVCGLRPAARIVGGKETKPNSWLWMAALIKNGGENLNFCGGVLITDYHVLTASHCLNKLIPQDIFVRLGEYDFSSEGSTTSEDHEIDYFIIHSSYDKFMHENDIAIIVLKEKASFTHFIRPICLPKKRKDYTNEVATVVGYGSSEQHARTAPKLREVTVPIWKKEDCDDAYSTNFTSGQLCAGFREGGRDSCSGDSGSPLMIQTIKQKWEAVGLVSFGIGCGQKNYPGIYTKVNKYIDWIKSNVN